MLRQQQTPRNALVAIATSPKTLSFVGIWLFGLYVCLYASAPVAVTPAMQRLYEAKLHAALEVKGYEDRFNDLADATHAVYEAKTWFWWFNQYSRAQVYALQEREAAALAEFVTVENERIELMKEAHEAVGVWSVYGVEEARELFWRSIEGGKKFAKRQTLWDMFFGFVMGRDENFGAFLLRVIVSIVFNVTLGLIGSLFGFAWGLWSLLIAYKASLLTSLLFFGTAMLAATSMVLLYMFVLFGSIGAAGFVLVTAASRQALQNENRQRQYLRPHRD